MITIVFPLPFFSLLAPLGFILSLSTRTIHSFSSSEHLSLTLSAPPILPGYQDSCSARSCSISSIYHCAMMTLIFPYGLLIFCSISSPSNLHRSFVCLSMLASSDLFARPHISFNPDASRSHRSALRTAAVIVEYESLVYFVQCSWRTCTGGGGEASK